MCLVRWLGFGLFNVVAGLCSASPAGRRLFPRHRFLAHCRHGRFHGHRLRRVRQRLARIVEPLRHLLIPRCSPQRTGGNGRLYNRPLYRWNCPFFISRRAQSLEQFADPRRRPHRPQPLLLRPLDPRPGRLPGRRGTRSQRRRIALPLRSIFYSGRFFFFKLPIKSESEMKFWI